MSEMKTVKEVCRLTGLNRKLLYLYDKEGIVKPSAYKNDGYEGLAKKTGIKVNYDGYKLYDEEAVIKLQQIAIYEKLHIKRSDIKARFTDKNNTKDLLEEQIQLLQSKKQEIEELLIVAEQLKLFGMKGELTKYYANMDFSDFAYNASRWKESKSMQIFEEVLTKTSNDFDVEADEVLDKLMMLSVEECESEKARNVVKSLFEISKKHFGFIGWMIIIFMALAADGGGEAIADIIAELGEEPVKNSSKAVLSYFKYDMDTLWDDYIKILAKYYDDIGSNYDTPGVKGIVGEMKKLLYLHTGLRTSKDYEIFFEFMHLSSMMEGNGYVSFTLKAMEYYHEMHRSEGESMRCNNSRKQADV